ncbi:MAG: murein L,D-transpeptidase catalytic domain family protein [Bacteroidota bacterium]|nr:murein L,D-transpeptidase catalytic domain family protein [Bacteroidota bacterium]
MDCAKTRTKATEALSFCRSKNYNTDFCILIDMGLHSGIKRFLIWDFKSDSILTSYLVGHGSCSGPWREDLTKEDPGFSNVEGSHCSSLGKYRIGERAHSDWGIRDQVCATWTGADEQ